MPLQMVLLQHLYRYTHYKSKNHLIQVMHLIYSCTQVCACVYVCVCLYKYYNSLSAWIVMGTVVTVIVVLAGIVITILLIIIFVFWKKFIIILLYRLEFKAEKEQSLQHIMHDKRCFLLTAKYQPSTYMVLGILMQSVIFHNSEGIDIKECSAYGTVISPQPTTEQPHIYESAIVSEM